MMVQTRWYSLRRRLLTLLLGGMTAGWLATMTFSYFDAHHEIDELFDAQLAQAAQTLLALAGEYDDDDDIAVVDADGHKYQNKLVFQIWDDRGRLLLRSRDAPTVLLADADGFSETHDDTRGHLRYYSQWSKERQLRVLVGENHHMRDELIGRIAIRLLIPALFGLPLIGLWVWFAIQHGLAPIDAMTEQVAGRAPDRLEPLVPATAPLEISPLLNALNGLFARVEYTLGNERRFTADAAHELRTPLAALATQAQVALRARDAEERDHAIAQIVASSQRASRLVDQLLTLARLDPTIGLTLGTVQLGALAAEVCAAHGAAALDKNIVLELDAPEDLAVAGNADLLRVLLRNLLDNAVRYTSPGGQVRVAIAAAATGVLLTVSDSGPGIPVAERANALLRFHRLAGQDTDGSGLGLSIVARIAELHGARFELADGIGNPGLAVSLHLVAA